MRRTNILLIVLFALSAQSCRDNFRVETPAGKSFQQDVAVLNDFIDINENMYEYFVNPNKHNSALTYVTHSDTEELYAVNPLNLDMFKESVRSVNQQTREASSHQNVDYIVMMTNRQIYIDKIKRDSPLELNQVAFNGHQSSAKAFMDIRDDIENQTLYEHYNYMQTLIQLNPQAYNNIGWAFYLTCEMQSGSTKEVAKVLFCGVGYNINPCFTWKWINQPYGNSTEWNFITTGRLTESDFSIARINFMQQ